MAAAAPAPSPRQVRFTTDEGTWISLDVSPDGRRIVFELAGDLYGLPVEGGRAERLTSGSAFDAQPRYSPDGQSIVFVSDRSGADNLWLLDAQGRMPRALTRETDAFFVSPAWTPDGSSIVASRSTTRTGHGREYQLFVYPLRANDDPRQLTGKASGEEVAGPADPAMVLGAAFGGTSSLFASVLVEPQWPIFSEWQIGVVDRSSGKVQRFTREMNGAVRPVLSPDGRYLVYGTQWERRSRLKLVDLASRESRWLGPDIERDASEETAPRRDLLPGAAFTPDSRAIIVAHHGKIWRVSVPDGDATPIPFSAEVDVTLAPAARFDYPLDERHVAARRIEYPQLSPDGRSLAFSALGKVWIRRIGSPPRQVSAGPGGAFFPAWSPDGEWLAYVTWDDLEGGAIWRVRTRTATQPEKLSPGRDFYEKLAYSADGARLVAARARFAERFGFSNETKGTGRGNSPEWVWLPSGGGAAVSITHINPPQSWGASSHYGRAHFRRGDAEHLYFSDPVDGLVSVRWDGTERQSLLRVQGEGFGKSEPAIELLLSPDGRRVAALLGNQLWLVEPSGGLPHADVLRLPGGAPAKRMSLEGADFPQWIRDGRSILWSLGATIFTQPVESATGRPERRDLSVRFPRPTPQGSLVLRGARVITMRGEEVIEKGDVLITGERIVAVGRLGTVRVPRGARILDVSGKTILPGYVDVHWHGSPPWGVHRTQVWEFQASLAYGVTTIRDPQPSTTDALTYADRISMGDVLGPRFFTTGPGIFESDGIRSLEDARAVARRYARFYRTETVKDYMTNADRQTHQWLVAAAREYRLTPTAEGNSDFKSSLTRILDGYGGQEHMATSAAYYGDLTRIIAASGITITPTPLQGQTGGQDFLARFVHESDLLRDPKARRFFPAEELEYLTVDARRGPLETRYTAQELAAQPISLRAAGGRIALGVHGAIEGLGAHWVLWTFVEGGMRPHDALRVGTLMGAQAIGHAADLGSIQPGKLADLQVLDGNPLEDIRQTLTLRYVSMGGWLYDAGTLEQLWPGRKPLGPQWWQGLGDPDCACALASH